MDIRRQRLAQLNSKFRQTGSSTNPPNLPSQTILPDSSRPLPRQQPRTKFYEKETIHPVSTTVRPDSAALKGQTTNPDRLAEKKYITLANLTKILQMLQSRTRVNEYDTSTVMSSSTSHSAKPRVQQHLQRTAVRWWRPTTRNSETSTQTSTSTTSSRFSSPLRKSSSSVQQKPKAFEQENFPLLVSRFLSSIDVRILFLSRRSSRIRRAKREFIKAKKTTARTRRIPNLFR